MVPEPSTDTVNPEPMAACCQDRLWSSPARAITSSGLSVVHLQNHLWHSSKLYLVSQSYLSPGDTSPIIKVLWKSCTETSCCSLFEGTLPGAQGSNSKTILKNFTAELPLLKPLTLPCSFLNRNYKFQWYKAVLELDTHSLIWAKGIWHVYWIVNCRCALAMGNKNSAPFTHKA